MNENDDKNSSEGSEKSLAPIFHLVSDEPFVEFPNRVVLEYMGKTFWASLKTCEQSDDFIHNCKSVKIVFEVPYENLH